MSGLNIAEAMSGLNIANTNTMVYVAKAAKAAKPKPPTFPPPEMENAPATDVDMQQQVPKIGGPPPKQGSGAKASGGAAQAVPTSQAAVAKGKEKGKAKAAVAWPMSQGWEDMDGNYWARAEWIEWWNQWTPTEWARYESVSGRYQPY